MSLRMSLIRPIVLLGAFSLAAVATIARPQTTPTPSPALLIAIEDRHVVVIADPLTMKVVSVVPTRDLPHNIAVSDDGRFAYVTTGTYGKGNSPDDHVSDEGVIAPNDDYISVIDLATQKEVRRVQTGLGSRIHGITFAGGKVYYTAEGYKAVGRYDPAIDKIDWMQGTGEGHTHLLVVTKDLKRIFTVNTSSNTVSAIVPWDDLTAYNAPPLKVVRIPIGNSPEGLGMSPDGKEVWAPNKRDGTVSIIDVQTLKVSQTVDLKTQVPLRLVFTPDGKRVLITDEFDGKVLVIDAVTRKVIKRMQVVEKTQEFTIERANTAVQNGVAIVPTSMLHEILVSPDSSHAYVPLMGSGDIAIVDMDKLEVTGHISTFPRAVLGGLGWARTR